MNGLDPTREGSDATARDDDRDLLSDQELLEEMFRAGPSEVMTLTPEDSRLLAETLLNPPEPTDAPIRAMRRHRDPIGVVTD